MSASLLDLAGVGRTVSVRGLDVPVTGISAKGLAVLFGRFPQLVDAVTGAGLDLSSLADLGPDVLAAVIAAGTGHPGDAKAEAVAASLSMSDQLTLIEEISAETFAGNPGNFMQRLEKLAAGVGVQVGKADS